MCDTQPNSGQTNTPGEPQETYWMLLERYTARNAFDYDTRATHDEVIMQSRWRKLAYHSFSALYFVNFSWVIGVVGVTYSLVPIYKGIIVLPFWLGVFIPHDGIRNSCSKIREKTYRSIFNDIGIIMSTQVYSYVSVRMTWHSMKQVARCAKTPETSTFEI
jgi:hypothetical protein